MNVVEHYTGKEITAVIPTIDHKQPMTQHLLSELESLGSDWICVEDSGPGFNFSKSMNKGIESALKREQVKFIILSNDDLHTVIGFEGMIKTLKEGKYGYVCPYLNGKFHAVHLSRSLLVDVMSATVAGGAPFYVLRQRRAAKKYISSSRYPIVSQKVFPMGRYAVQVQPFSIFRAEILEKDKFDEDFLKHRQDGELAIRLHLKGIIGLTSKDWNVTHLNHVSFNLNPNEKNEESYRLDQRAKDMAIFAEKYKNVRAR